jgi:hypothetical protein
MLSASYIKVLGSLHNVTSASCEHSLTLPARFVLPFHSFAARASNIRAHATRLYRNACCHVNGTFQSMFEIVGT